MSRVACLVVMLVGVSVCVSVGVAEATIQDAANEVDAAIRAVRDEGGRCQRKVLAELQSVRGELGPDGESLRRLARRLGRIEEDADAACGRRIARQIGRARRELDGGGGRAQNGGGGGGGGVQSEAPALVSVLSEVDPRCVLALKATYPHAPDQNAILGWLGVCRTTPYALEGCAAGTPNLACERAAASIHGFQMTSDTQAAFARDCQNVHCAFAVGPRTVHSATNAACVQQRRAGHQFAADGETVAGWAVGCKTTINPANCAITRNLFVPATYEVMKRALGFAITPEVATRLVVESKTIEYQCW
jgi:hypothetical protein